MAVGRNTDSNKIVLEVKVDGQAGNLSDTDRQLLSDFKENAAKIIKKTQSDNILLANGETLSKEELRGERGERGLQGAQGIQGVQGQRGERGLRGEQGADGKSAYQIAVDNGFQGTEAEWLNSLKAEQTTYVISKEDFNQSGSDFYDYLQNIVENHSNVLIKEGTYEIALRNLTGVKPKNNCTITFEPLAKIKVLPNGFSSAFVFDCRQRNNIIFINPTLEGDKYEHLNAEGQWGYGINANHARNIRVYNGHFSKFWGDGINLRYSSNVTVDDCVFDDNRRQGMSIEGNVENVMIRCCVFKNTQGQNPGYGIDIEPNWNCQFVRNIKIIDCEFSNNGNVTSYHCGFCFSSHRMHLAEPINGSRNKELTDVDISIELHNPKFYGDSLILSSYNDYLKGFIKVYNPEFYNPRHTPILLETHSGDNLQSEIINPKVYNAAKTPVRFTINQEKKVKNAGNKNVKITRLEVYRDEKGGLDDFVIVNTVNTQHPEDFHNVEITDIKAYGYSRLMLSSNYNNVSASGRISVADSDLEIKNISFPQQNLTIDRRYLDGFGKYTGSHASPAIYLTNDLSPCGFDLFFENLSENKADLKICFGRVNRKIDTLVEGFSATEIQELILPYGAKIVLRKIGENRWKMIEGSRNITSPQLVLLKRGNTAGRPSSLTISDVGFDYYDTDLQKFVKWSGTNWIEL